MKSVCKDCRNWFWVAKLKTKNAKPTRLKTQRMVFVCPDCLKRNNVLLEGTESVEPVCPACKKSEFSSFWETLICDSNECGGLIYYDTSVLYKKNSL